MKNDTAFRSKTLRKSLEEGFRALKEKDFYLAQMKIRAALKEDAKAVLEELKQTFLDHEKKGDHQTSVVLGSAIQPYLKDDPAFLNLCGNAARRHNDEEKALKFYQAALLHDPHHEETLLNMAALETAAPYYGKEVKYYLQGLLKGENFFYPLYRIEADWPDSISLALQKQGKDFDPGAVMARMEELIQVADAHQERRKFNLALYSLHAGKYNRSIQLLEEIEAKESQIPYIQLLLCIALFQKGLRQEAMELFAIEAEIAQEERLLHLNMGLAGIWSGDKAVGYKHLLLGKQILEERGILSCSKDMLEQASLAFTEGKIQRSLQLYDAISPEFDDSFFLERIANCHLKLGETGMALDAYERLVQDPEYKEATVQKLEALLVILRKKSRECLDQSKYAIAAEYCELALRIRRSETTLKLAIWAYKGLNGRHRVALLEEELDCLQESKVDSQGAVDMSAQLTKGKAAYKAGEIDRAIHCFESSMRAKKNEEAYLLLSKLYKNFNQPRALSDLAKTWERHQESQQRHDKYRKAAKPVIPSILGKLEI